MNIIQHWISLFLFILLPEQLLIIFYEFLSILMLFFLYKITMFLSSYSISYLLTKLLGKKNLLQFFAIKSASNFSLSYFTSFVDILILSNGNSNIEDFFNSWFFNQGWFLIYFTPFKDPILYEGFLVSRPLISCLTSLDTTGSLGNVGSEFIIDTKISSFLGA